MSLQLSPPHAPRYIHGNSHQPCLGARLMSKRHLTATLIAVAILLSATAAWSYYKLAGAGETMIEQANKYLATVSAEHKARAVVAYDDKTRTDWHFIPKPDGAREGLRVRDMNESQRQAAHALLKSALSEAGYNKATKIMALEGLLHDLEKAKGGKQIRDTERYFFTIYGTPTPEGKWGLSVEGHHLSLNFVVEKGHVASTTPSAFGANPAIVKSDNVPSIAKGTRVLAKEETLALDLVASLTPDQKKEATIADKPPSEVRAAGNPQPATDAPKGILAEKLTGQQRGILQSLIDEYANSFPPDVAKERLEAVKSDGPAKTYFAWAGSVKEGEGRYYCIQGPSFQIEFVNVQPDSAGNPANHIHSVWRDMRGDFAIPVK
jgi:hypothetical protein